ncbi:MAG: hypothetical protein DLM55_02995 [Acidimicrobiales bacterium]|nr:MAG: hypothetical protein DLM55_02995 [Acidimicrobiales bacterium]
MCALVIACAAAVVLGLAAAFLVPLRIADVRVPVCLLIVVLGNPVTVWFAHRVGDFGWGALAPAVAWFSVMLALGTSRSEGDLVLTNDWVSLFTVLLGGASFAFAGFFVVRRAAPLSFPGAARLGDR